MRTAVHFLPDDCRHLQGGGILLSAFRQRLEVVNPTRQRLNLAPSGPCRERFWRPHSAVLEWRGRRSCQRFPCGAHRGQIAGRGSSGALETWFRPLPAWVAAESGLLAGVKMPKISANSRELSENSRVFASLIRGFRRTQLTGCTRGRCWKTRPGGGVGPFRLAEKRGKTGVWQASATAAFHVEHIKNDCQAKKPVGP